MSLCVSVYAQNYVYLWNAKDNGDSNWKGSQMVLSLRSGNHLLELGRVQFSKEVIYAIGTERRIDAGILILFFPTFIDTDRYEAHWNSDTIISFSMIQTVFNYCCDFINEQRKIVGFIRSGVPSRRFNELAHWIVSFARLVKKQAFERITSKSIVNGPHSLPQAMSGRMISKIYCFAHLEITKLFLCSLIYACFFPVYLNHPSGSGFRSR